MKANKAFEIFCDINSEEHTEDEKVEAIYEVINSPTHNSITKSKMMEVVEYLFDKAYEITIMSMTLDDAIKHCNEVADGALCEGTVNHKSCGEEHRQLAEWLEEYKALKEKSTPKTPDFEGDGYDDGGNIILDTWICPNCGGKHEVDYEKYDYCPECGQALSWEYPDEEDDKKAKM